jgi:predicted ester cyclase
MFEDAFPDFRYEVKDMIAEGEKIAVRDVFRSTHQGDFTGILATGKPGHHKPSTSTSSARAG